MGLLTLPPNQSVSGVSPPSPGKAVNSMLRSAARRLAAFLAFGFIVPLVSVLAVAQPAQAVDSPLSYGTWVDVGSANATVAGPDGLWGATCYASLRYIVGTTGPDNPSGFQQLQFDGTCDGYHSAVDEGSTYTFTGSGHSTDGTGTSCSMSASGTLTRIDSTFTGWSNSGWAGTTPVGGIGRCDVTTATLDLQRHRTGLPDSSISVFWAVDLDDVPEVPGAALPDDICPLDNQPVSAKMEWWREIKLDGSPGAYGYGQATFDLEKPRAEGWYVWTIVREDATGNFAAWAYPAGSDSASPKTLTAWWGTTHVEQRTPASPVPGVTYPDNAGVGNPPWTRNLWRTPDTLRVGYTIMGIQLAGVLPQIGFHPYTTLVDGRYANHPAGDGMLGKTDADDCLYYFGTPINTDRSDIRNVPWAPLGDPVTPGPGNADDDPPAHGPRSGDDGPVESGCSWSWTDPSSWATGGFCLLGSLLKQIVSQLDDLVGAVTGLGGRIADAVADALSGILGGLVDAVLDGLSALFVPDMDAASDRLDNLSTRWSNSAPGDYLGAFSGAVTGLAEFSSPGCLGPSFSIPLLPGDDTVIRPFRACEGVMQTTAGIVRIILSIGVWLAAAAAAVRLVGSSLGLDLSIGRGGDE